MGNSAYVFLSYRREDTQHVAGRLADRLIDRVGEDRVFIDIDSIDPGLDFEVKLLEAINKTAVMLVLIGPRWLQPIDKKGRRRIDDPHDFVFLEIRFALQRGIHVIPVLLDGADIPKSHHLPAAVRLLSRRNAVRIDHETFRADASRLVDTVERYLAAAGPDASSFGAGSSSGTRTDDNQPQAGDTFQAATVVPSRSRDQVLELTAFGNRLSVSGDQEGARAAYEEAIEMDPSHAEARAGNAVCRLLLGMVGEATEEMIRARGLATSIPSIIAVELSYARGLVEARRQQTASSADAAAVRSCVAGVNLGGPTARPISRLLKPRLLEMLDRASEIPLWMCACTYGGGLTIMRRPCLLLITSQRMIWASVKYRGQVEVKTLDLEQGSLAVQRTVSGLSVDPEYEMRVGETGPFKDLSENLWANFVSGLEPSSLFFPVSAFPMADDHVEGVIRVLSGAVWMTGEGWLQYQRQTGSVVTVSSTHSRWDGGTDGKGRGGP